MKKLKQKIKKYIMKCLNIENPAVLKERIADLEQMTSKQQKSIQDMMLYQIHCQEDSPAVFPNAMNKGELGVLKKYLNNAEYYLEFGSGGSTFTALTISNIKKIFSVESDLTWIQYLSSWKIIKNALNTSRLSFIHIDIGKTGAWGFPVDDTGIDNYYKYSGEVFKDHPSYFDTILVDGRFRVACVLKSLLESKGNITILFHDYPEREHYHIIEKYLDIIEKQDRLVVFRPKTNLDYGELRQCYEEYKNDCR